MTRKKVREHLFQMLFAIDFHQREDLEEQADEYLDTLEKRSDEAGREKDESLEQLKKELKQRFHGVVDHLEEIDRQVGLTSKGWNINRLSKPDITVLRLAVYEILYDDEVPAGVAVDEGVSLAKQYGTDRSPGFVNGILGTIIRDQEKLV